MATKMRVAQGSFSSKLYLLIVTFMIFFLAMSTLAKNLEPAMGLKLRLLIVKIMCQTTRHRLCRIRDGLIITLS